MPMYFFRLKDSRGPPDEEGEELPDDAAALAFAKKIQREIHRRKAGKSLSVFVFNAKGDQITGE